MYFVFQSLTWGFLLVLLPVLIHLINMLRHKRVKWAAMDFLLKSYKRHRRWVWLKQLLLLLMRMALIALLVAMLAQWRPKDWWFGRFGGKVTHHYVLLDDSYSMSEQSSGKSDFELATSAIKEIGRRAVLMDGPQRFTLIRFSQAATASDQTDPTQIADLNAEVVDVDFDQRLEEVRRTFDVTQLATGPRPAFDLLRQLLDEPSTDNRLVYVVTDFRENQWQSPAELRQMLMDIDKQASDVQLIDCALPPAANLAVTDVQPAGGTQAAGVPLFVNVRIKNYGSQPVQQIQLSAETLAYDEALELTGDPENFRADKLPQPIKLIDSIGPGETIERRIQVFFEKPGQHVIHIQLPDDPVLTDNHRWTVLDITPSERVLVVDGDPEQRNAFFLQSIFEPSQRANTGIQTVIHDARYLAATPVDELQNYTAVYLTDVQRLDPAAVEHLTEYVDAGGGVALFLGPSVDFRFYSDVLYDEGRGLFPLSVYGDVPLVRELDEAALESPDESQIDRLLEQPDVDIEGSNHPIFRNLLLGRNPIIRMVKVDKYVRPRDDDWQPAPDSGVEVLAKLRNGFPLVLEKRVGSGRVVTFLTTYAPLWNDLALGPNVLVALNLQSYLAANRRETPTHMTGDPLEVAFNGEVYREDVTFILPGAKDDARVPIARQAEAEPGSGVLRVTLGPPAADATEGEAGTSDEQPPAEADESNEPASEAASTDPLEQARETARSGVYEVWNQTKSGQYHVRRFALNVDPAEGNLAAAASEQLLARLAPLQPTYRHASDVQQSALDDSEFNPSLMILGVLILLLILEQIMAYSTSYHPARGAAR